MIFRLGFLTRALLLLYGELQDSISSVKYTDIDYKVYTDAAAFVARGRSPYERSTYRYTPLLAYLLTPNVWCHPLSGKILFCAADLMAAWSTGTPARIFEQSLLCWLFNPFTITISTRGSGEALVAIQILLMLRCLLQGKFTIAAVLLGISVHWRLFPIIYALPIMLWLPQELNMPTAKKPWQTQLMKLLSKDAMHFAAVAATTFLALGYGCYLAYGYDFLHETYLYHSGRKDPRHNFSVYFYNAYLEYGGAGVSSISWLASVSQLTSTAAIGAVFAQELPLCMMLQTMAFVVFNKVCTAQYFVWWFTLLPLVLPTLDISWETGISRAAGAWMMAQAHWLSWAYMLEFEGMAVHLPLWLASIVMCVGTVYLMKELIRCSKPQLFATYVQQKQN